MQRGIRKNTNRIMFPDLAISQPLIQTVMKGMIIVLCLYIAIKCVNLITADKAGEVGNQVVSDTSKMLAKEIVEKCLSLHLMAEGDEWNIVPNNSTTVYLIVLQGIAIEVGKRIGVTLDDFRINHPGGGIGAQLSGKDLW